MGTYLGQDISGKNYQDHFHILGLEVNRFPKTNRFHLDISGGFVNVCVKW